MDNNIQNLSSDKIDDVFDLQGLHSKMNAESPKERQEMLSALQEKARRYLPETERFERFNRVQAPSIRSLRRGICPFAWYACQCLSKNIPSTKCAIRVLLFFLSCSVLLPF